jgi:hypothetical protein
MLHEHAQFEDGSVSVEAGIMEILSRMETGRFKGFSRLVRRIPPLPPQRWQGGEGARRPNERHALCGDDAALGQDRGPLRRDGPRHRLSELGHLLSV